MKKISFAFAAVALFAFAACSNGTETAPADSATNDSNVAAPVDSNTNDSNAGDSGAAAAPAAEAAAPAAH